MLTIFSTVLIFGHFTAVIGPYAVEHKTHVAVSTDNAMQAKGLHGQNVPHTQPSVQTQSTTIPFLGTTVVPAPMKYMTISYIPAGTKPPGWTGFELTMSFCLLFSWFGLHPS